MAKTSIRIGCGGAWEFDLIPPAVLVAEKGDIQYLCAEHLAERTLGLAQQRKASDPNKGYNPVLDKRIKALWPICSQNGIKFISNMGAANPIGAASRTLEIIRDMGMKKARVAAVVGDDVRDAIKDVNPQIWETGKTLSDLCDKLGKDLVSANAYLGAEPIVEALAAGADIVLTGRCADPAIFIAPMIYEFGWEMNDWSRLSAGVVCGHLMECSVQCTGGYFADPPYKNVPKIKDIGFPLTIVDENGRGVVTKVEGTGGLVTPASCKEQLLYEVHDPRNYITPDVIADFSEVQFEQIQPDAVRVTGARGKKRPEMLKATLCFWEDWIGEGQVGYACPDAYERAQYVVKEMIQPMLNDLKDDGQIGETRIDYIGVNSHFGPAAPEPKTSLNEVRIRVAARCKSKEAAEQIGIEMMNIGIFGPIGWGLATTNVIPTLGVYSALIPREAVTSRVIFPEL